jgi:hypothetical protein
MPESPSRKTWYEILASLTPLIVGVCVSGVAAFYTQLNNARQLQLNQITALDKFRGLLLSESNADREFAYASFAALGYESLALKIIQTQQDPAGRAVAEGIKESGSSADKAEAVAALVSIPARVFIHVGDEVQRASATALGEALKRQGFAVQGVEKVAAVPKVTSVRYFNEEDRAAADSIASSLNKNGVPDAVAQKVTRYKVRPGSLEVWLAAPVHP